MTTVADIKRTYIKLLCTVHGIPFQDVVIYDRATEPEKYKKFFNALSIDPPTLIILKEGSAARETRIQGVYHEPTNCMILPESVLNAFEAGDRYTEYVVAHEAGHATAKKQCRVVNSYAF